jgi:hypothetical protein
MGPAVLITIGVLFLLDQMGHLHWMDFSYTWPALLIVIGLIKLLEHSASMDEHIPRQFGPTAWQSRDQRFGAPQNPQQPVPPGYQGYPPQPQGSVAPPPPIAPAGFITPPQPGPWPDDKEGHNG